MNNTIHPSQSERIPSSSRRNSSNSTQQTWQTRTAWYLFGLVSAIVGITAGIEAAASHAAGSSHPFAGLIVIFTVPGGYVLAGLLAICFARATETRSPSQWEERTRHGLAAWGIGTPIFAVLANRAFNDALAYFAG